MAHNLAQVLDGTALRAALAHEKQMRPICEFCGKPVAKRDAYDFMPNVHEDCYFEKLGDVVEAHPIHRPGGTPKTPL